MVETTILNFTIRFTGQANATFLKEKAYATMIIVSYPTTHSGTYTHGT